MPRFRARGRRGFKGKRKSKRGRRGNSTVALMKRVLANKPEWKSMDESGAAQSIGLQSAPFTMVLNLLQEGVGTNDRIGRRVQNKLLSWQYTLNWNDNELAHDIRIRVMIVRQTQTKGVAIILGQILADISSADLAMVSPYELGSGTYRVMFDRVHTLSLNGRSGRNVKTGRRLTQQTLYEGTTGLIGNVSTNSYHIFAFSTVAVDQPTIDLFTRLRYTDS